MVVALPTLKKPPIVEVVCGVFFEPIPALDPVLVGHYWTKKRHDFPNRELKAPVREGPGLVVTEGPGPLRCWLITRDEERILQLQQDRFYYNWRKRTATYPRFSGEGGVMEAALREYAQLGEFLAEETAARPVTTRVELSKIDLVPYDSTDELRRMLPIVDALLGWTHSPTPELGVQLAESADGVEQLVTISNAFLTPDLGRAVKIETRANCAPSDDDLRGALISLNAVLNEAFRGLFSEYAFSRFKGDDE